jgi:hypothetical protein
VELGGARWPGSGGGAGELGRLEVGDGTDSWAQLIERCGRGGRLGRREAKGKTYFLRRRDRRAGWMIRRGMVLACGGSATSLLAGPEAEWAARSAEPKSSKRISELKIGFLNLPRLWKFVEGDLGGILT